LAIKTCLKCPPNPQPPKKEVKIVYKNGLKGAWSPEKYPADANEMTATVLLKFARETFTKDKNLLS
jgi:hypothetical protein